jgi:hypothetical protein
MLSSEADAIASVPDQLKFIPDEFDRSNISGKPVPEREWFNHGGLALNLTSPHPISSMLCPRRQPAPSKLETDSTHESRTLFPSRNSSPMAPAAELRREPIKPVSPSVYKAKKSRLAKTPDIATLVAQFTSEEEIEYYPGIYLRLGKERDSVIRPLLRSVFRQDKEAFREALKVQNLNYGDMRLWNETQLCTALWVADRFLPGAWKTAVRVHWKKVVARKSREAKMKPSKRPQPEKPDSD